MLNLKQKFLKNTIMNLSLKVTGAKCRVLIALGVLPLFLHDAAWAHTALRTIPLEVMLVEVTGDRVVPGMAAGLEPAGDSERLTVLPPEASNGSEEAIQCNGPGAFITPSASGLSCRNRSITLSASSSVTTVSYLWSGPESYASMLKDVVISLPGTYYLTVTNTANGCTSTASLEILQDTNLPGAQAGVSHQLDCAHETVTLQAGTSITNATFRWIGPNFVSLNQNPPITVPGGYTLNVTNPTNGCTSTATIEVVQNLELPGVTTTVPATITCSASQVELGATSPTANVTYHWTGPENFSMPGQNPLAGVAGTYTVKATDPRNSCQSSATVTVSRNIDPPGATITPSGQVNCTVTSITLAGNSPAPDVTYDWTGPGTYHETTQSPSAYAAGDYVLKVTKASTGCTSEVTYTLVPNTTRPQASGLVIGQLNCTNSSVALQGSSTTPGVLSYKWTGPTGSNFVSYDAYTTTSIKGVYRLTVVNTANTCDTSVPVLVIQNTTQPINIQASATGVITCSDNVASLSASSSTTGVVYSWTGPGAISPSPSSANATVSVAGDYRVVITNPANNCAETRTVNVPENKAEPEGVAINPPLVLTCTREDVALEASAATAGVTYNWTGAGPITGGNTASASVTQPGDYSLKVTHPASGCFVTQIVTVGQDIAQPEGVSITPPLVLTCTRENVALEASSGTTGVQYLWTGTGPITGGNSASASVTQPGDYSLKVTHPTSGCFVNQTVTVGQDIAQPEGVSITPPLVLTCTRQDVALEANTSTTGVQYLWTGTGPITGGATASASVRQPGDYSVKVTHPSSGCFVTRNVTVQQNIIAPENVRIAPPAILTCARQNVSLDATSDTGGVTYLWSGPGTIPDPAIPSISVATQGTYNLVVTNSANGCTTPASVTVDQNTQEPGVTPDATGIFTCNVSSVTLRANSQTTGLQYAWTGPGTFTSSAFDPAVTENGTYYITVTNPVNGCTSSSQIATQQNKTAPFVEALVHGVITCSLEAVFMEARSDISPVGYQWSGPENYTSNEELPITNISGLYTVEATNPANGCKNSNTVFVSQDKTLPDGVTARVLEALTCTRGSVNLLGGSATTDVTYKWLGPEGYNSTFQNPEAFLSGLYKLTVTRNSNGCKASAETTVLEDKIEPEGVTAVVSSNITCRDEQVTLTGSSATTGTLDYRWSGPGGFTSNDSAPVVTVQGPYTLRITNTANGCFDETGITVVRDVTPPGVDAGVIGKITCAVDRVTITAHSDASVGYSWEGPDDFTSTVQNPEVGVGGVYTVTAESTVNGCTSTANTTVVVDKQLPQNVMASFAGTNNTITCTNNSVTLTGVSSTGGVVYSWSGPGPVSPSPSAAQVSVTTGGLYTLTVTNPLNECQETTDISVSENKIAPQQVSIDPPLSIICTRTIVTLHATSGTTGVSYSWSNNEGKAITNPLTDSPSVMAGGTYHLVVTDQGNGCTTPASVVVNENKTAPDFSIANPLNTTELTCFVSPIELRGSSTAPGATFRWTSLAGHNVATPSIFVTAPSDYTLTVTDPANGCETVSSPRRITQRLVNITPTANVTGTIDCVNLSVGLLGGSSAGDIPSISYSWTGPAGSGFTSSLKNPTGIVIPGLYTLVINTPGGCTNNATVTVQKNIAQPEDVTAEVERDLTDCDGNDFVFLLGGSSTADAGYSWTGPEGFDPTTEQSPFTILPGTYTLVVSHPHSHCTETREVTVNCPSGLAGARSAKSTSSSSPATVQYNATEPLMLSENPFTVGVYPNPAADQANFEFTPDGNYEVVLEVFTLLNVKVATPYTGEVSTGKRYIAVFDSQNHINGVYVYRIRYGSGKTKEGRFVVMH